MSADNIPAFFEKAKNSPELQLKIAEIPHTSAQAIAEALAALSNEAGSPFTAAEFLSAPERELSGDELARTAGGAQIDLDNINWKEVDNARIDQIRRNDPGWRTNSVLIGILKKKGYM